MRRASRTGVAALLLFVLLAPLPAPLTADDDDTAPALDDDDEIVAPLCALSVTALPAVAPRMSAPDARMAFEALPASAAPDFIPAETAPSRAPPRF